MIGESRHRNLYLPYVAERIKAINPDALIVVLIREPVSRAYSHWWHWYSRRVESDSFEKAVEKNLQRLQNSAENQNQVEEIYCSGLQKNGEGPFTSYVDSGYYADQLLQYFEHFPAEQVVILRNEDLNRDREGVLLHLLRKLHLDESLLEEVRFESVYNKKKADRRFPDWVYMISHFSGLDRLEFVQKIGGFIRARASGVPEVDAETVEILKSHYRPHNKKLEELLGIDLSGWEEIKLN